MHKVLLKKSELLAKIKENHIKHNKDYELTVKNFKLAAKANLDKFNQEAPGLIEEGKQPYFPSMAIPQSYSESYAMAEAMMSMSVEDEILLTQEEFKSYVLDKWSWSANFLAVSGCYNNFGK